jgi:hypothetical protein
MATVVNRMLDRCLGATSDGGTFFRRFNAGMGSG